MNDAHSPPPSPACAPGWEPHAPPDRRTPTGRRTLTPAQLVALDHPPPASGGPSKAEASAAFSRAIPALGVIGVRALLSLLLSRSLPQDWLGGGRPMVWVSNEWLCARLGVREGRLKQLISLAFEAGLIAMRDSGNGHRRGIREKGEGGRIISAFGFDLSPLAARHGEFRAMADAWERQEAVVRQLRAEVSSLRREVLTLADVGWVTAPGAADWGDVAGRARQIAAQARQQKDMDVLRMLADELAALRAKARVALDPAQAAAEAETPAGTVNSDPKGSLERPLYTTTSQPEILKGSAKAQEQVQPEAKVSEPAQGSCDPLRGFPVSPALVVAVAPQFQAFVPGSRRTRDQVISAAWHVRSHLGISEDAWAEACLAFGRWGAAVALAAIAGRHATGGVNSPGGLLRHMVQLHDKDELRLDRTLRGLVARLAEAQAGAGRAAAPAQAMTRQPVSAGADATARSAWHHRQDLWEARMRPTP